MMNGSVIEALQMVADYYDLDTVAFNKKYLTAPKTNTGNPCFLVNVKRVLADAKNQKSKNPPQFTEYHIWCEGFSISGAYAKAEYIGCELGVSFSDAVRAYFAKYSNRDFNSENLTVFGCRLFQSEEDARKSFG